ncbi:MAG: succinate dehydrogenase/fumarate reductase cytochrome b subunit [Tidjanibacter sp.]|nr:succinate dehydrogenase/fumarate reductase cytochrome b subunit [Tidjanibacter sp.]
MSGSIFTSSIGKKMFMSISGCILVLFLTFHMCMNLALVFSDEAYNAICGFLGANWYAVAATVLLAVVIVAHIALAIVLTIQNRKARGSIRYAVTKREPGVEWSSKNMLVLGIVVLLGLAFHLVHFWYKMMFAELAGAHEVLLGAAAVSPTDGAAIVRYYFAQWPYVLLYLVWFAAIWFHLTHGVWSMMHSLGLNSKVWFKRMKCISFIVATLIIGGFALCAIILFLQGNGLLPYPLF